MVATTVRPSAEYNAHLAGLADHNPVAWGALMTAALPEPGWSGVPLGDATLKMRGEQSHHRPTAEQTRRKTQKARKPTHQEFNQRRRLLGKGGGSPKRGW